MHRYRAAKSVPTDALAVDAAWEAAWIPLLSAYAQLCLNPARELRQNAISSLQRTLLAPEILQNTDVDLTIIFERVFFPLLEELLKPQVFRRDPDGMGETRLRASALLCKIFLQYLTQLSQRQGMHTMTALWLKILGYQDRLMHSGRRDQMVRPVALPFVTRAKDADRHWFDQFEAVPELLKNVLLVMNASGFLLPPSSPRNEDQARLWTATFERIQPFLPELQRKSWYRLDSGWGWKKDETDSRLLHECRRAFPAAARPCPVHERFSSTHASCRSADCRAPRPGPSGSRRVGRQLGRRVIDWLSATKPAFLVQNLYTTVLHEFARGACASATENLYERYFTNSETDGRRRSLRPPHPLEALRHLLDHVCRTWWSSIPSTRTAYMVTPSPGPSRGPTPTSSTHASASSSRASNASKLNPNSATFSYLQQHEPVPSRASPPLHPGQAMPYNTPFPAPPPPSRNGMYGMPMPVGYSPYPISSATTMSGVGPSAAQAAAPSGSWSAPRVGGWPGPSTYGPGPIHHSGPHHHSQPPYYTQSQLPPPAQNRMTPPVPPPSANGILLPLSNGPPPHLAATMAAAGYPHPMPNSPMPPNLPLQTVPHPGLLPPFSPPRPLPPSAAPAPRLVPAPSLPVSPATPLPPQSVPPPPSRTSTSATNPTMPDNLAPAFGAALSPPPPAAAATRSAHGPRGYGIRRKKDHLPAPKDAKPLDFAPNLRMPGGFAGIFRTPSSLGSPGSASGRSRTVTAPSEQKPSAATASAPVTLPTGSPAARDTGESAALASKDAHRPSVLGQAAKLATNGETGESPVPPLSPTRSREQSAAPPLSPTPSGGPSASTPLSPVATSTASHTTSPRTAPSSIKRSWADLVRPAAGSQPAKGVNGVQPISASIGPDPSATLQAGDTLLSTVHRAPPHEHMPHAPTPRGLINNGNLCFANSTLQALVYCGSFWNLMNIVERGTKKNLRDEMTGVAAAEKNASERSAVEAT